MSPPMITWSHAIAQPGVYWILPVLTAYGLVHLLLTFSDATSKKPPQALFDIACEVVMAALGIALCFGPFKSDPHPYNYSWLAMAALYAAAAIAGCAIRTPPRRTPSGRSRSSRANTSRRRVKV